jgi:hypothetical protein
MSLPVNGHPHTHRRLPAFLAGVVLLACALVALAQPSVAMASKCGDQVLLDWSDNGDIDRKYPLHCYGDAIASIPTDFLDYGDAEDVISRALAEAQNTGGTGDPDGDETTTDGGSTPGSGDPDDPDGTPREPSVSGAGSEVTPAADSSDPSSIPIPLLLLAVMSLALLGAGGLGYLSRRRNGGGDGLGDDELPSA